MSAITLGAAGTVGARPAPVRAAGSVPRRTALRVTRRGRLLLSMVAGALTVAGVLSTQTAVADAPSDAVPVVTLTVEPGDTLWSIAGSVARPGEDLRDVVDRVAELNALPGSSIQAGQELLVPVRP